MSNDNRIKNILKDANGVKNIEIMSRDDKLVYCGPVATMPDKFRFLRVGDMVLDSHLLLNQATEAMYEVDLLPSYADLYDETQGLSALIDDLYETRDELNYALGEAYDELDEGRDRAKARSWDVQTALHILRAYRRKAESGTDWSLDALCTDVAAALRVNDFMFD